MQFRKPSHASLISHEPPRHSSLSCISYKPKYLQRPNDAKKKIIIDHKLRIHRSFNQTSSHIIFYNRRSKETEQVALVETGYPLIKRVIRAAVMSSQQDPTYSTPNKIIEAKADRLIADNHFFFLLSARRRESDHATEECLPKREKGISRNPWPRLPSLPVRSLLHHRG